MGRTSTSQTTWWLIVIVLILVNPALAQKPTDEQLWSRYTLEADEAKRRGRDYDRIGAWKKASKISSKFGPQDARHIKTLRALATAISESGVSNRNYGKMTELIKVYEELITICEQDSVSLQDFLKQLARVEFMWACGLPEGEERTARLARAEQLLLRRLEVNQGDEPRMQWSHNSLAEHYRATRQIKKAEEHARKGLALAEKVDTLAQKNAAARGGRPRQPSMIRNALETLAEVLETKGEEEAALAIRARREATQYIHFTEWADFDEARGDLKFARSYRQQAWKVWDEAQPLVRLTIGNACREKWGRFDPPSPPLERPDEAALAPEQNPNRGMKRPSSYYLHGRVVDATGSPLGGAEIKLKENGRLLAEGLSEKDGVFQMDALLLWGVDYTVSITLEGYMRESSRFSSHIKPKIVWMEPEITK